MPKKPINQLFLNRIKPPKKGRVDYADTGEPGLHLRITENGTMTWSVMYRVAGKQFRQTLGTVADIPKVSDARDLAAESKKKASSGVNPVEQRRAEAKRAAANTVAGAVERYFRYLEQDRKRRPATLKGYRQIFNHDVLPAWGDRPIASITEGDVHVLLNKKKSSRERKREGATGGAGVQANRVLARLQTFFVWCTKEKSIAVDPTFGIAPPVTENERDRVLSTDEMKAFWIATEAVDARRQDGIPCGALFRLLLLTAQRKSEVGGMRWSEIDTAKCQWTIPKERAKNGKEHFVHLSDFAMEVLKRQPKDRDLIFSGVSGGKTTSPNFAWAKSCVDAEMQAVLPNLSPWVLHDLRRTATTVMAGELKIAPHVADKVLNHTGGGIKGVAAIYNRYEYLDERKDALEGLGRYIRNLVEPGGGGNVVNIRSRAS